MIYRFSFSGFLIHLPQRACCCTGLFGVSGHRDCVGLWDGGDTEGCGDCRMGFLIGLLWHPGAEKGGLVAHLEWTPDVTYFDVWCRSGS